MYSIRLFAALLLLPLISLAQHHSQLPHEFADHAHVGHNHAPGEPCGTDAVHEQLLESQAVQQSDREALEAYTRDFIQKYENGTRKKSSVDGNNNSTYVIPTVVHVVWGAPGLTPGGDDSISIRQIETQFEVFFEDFRNVPGTRPYDDNGIDMGIEFALATIDPNGNPTTGVTYTFDPELAVHTSFTEGFALKAPLRWDINKYMNIYIVASIETGGGGGGTVLGYATFPSAGNPLDGLVMRSDCMGRLQPSEGGTATGPGGSSRWGGTGTHEAGHWLNLFHPFQSSCGGDCAVTGDRICDTPPTFEENFGTPGTRQNTCSNDGFIDRMDNPRNFMDYVSDAHKTHFSRGQYLRSIAALENIGVPNRFNVWQESNLLDTGTGKYGPTRADFKVKENGYATADEQWRAFTTIGGNVKFYNYSWGQPDQFEWTFEGGTPASSTDALPTVQYDLPGTYDVQLIVENTGGFRDTLLIEDYVTVFDNAFSLPYEEGFEDDPDNLPSGYLIENRDIINGATNKTWEVVDLTGGFGNSTTMLRMPFTTYSSQFQKDGLILPPLNLMGETHATLNFSTSYAPLYYNVQSGFVSPLVLNDSLEVLVSADGGANWESIWYNGGRDLSYGPDLLTENNQLFIPQANQWRSDTVSLDPYLGNSHVLVKFLATNGWGNNLFLDDIKVEQFQFDVVSRSENSLANSGFDLAPNPATDAADVLFDLPTSANVVVSLYAPDGRKIWQGSSLQLSAGTHRVPLQVQGLANGLYVVKADMGDVVLSQKLLKQ